MSPVKPTPRAPNQHPPRSISALSSLADRVSTRHIDCIRCTGGRQGATHIDMIRRPPTSLSVQEADVETLKAHRRAKMMKHNPNLTSSSFSSIRPDESSSVHDHPHHGAAHPHHHHHSHHHHARQRSEQDYDEQDDPGTQPGLSQQENHNPNQPQNVNNNT